MSKTPEFDDCWVCEGCGRATEGVNPPDKCSMCDHEYFENISDMLQQSKSATQH